MIERLDVDNYSTWSIRMRALLISKGLWGAISGDSTDNDKDEKALAYITLHVKDHHLMTVGNCTTAKQAWDTLKGTYEAKTAARKLLLRRELTELKMGATEALTMYATRAKDLQAQLRTAGEDVKDDELAMHFLSGLPPWYDMISTVLTCGDRVLSVDEMMPKLLPVEQKAQPERPDRYSEAALAAKFRKWGMAHGPKPGRGDRPGYIKPPRRMETRECFYCGRRGHIEANCGSWVGR